MDIISLGLNYFRNFGEGAKVDFPKGRLLVVAAPNATGKTNFLEAMVILFRGKSWRASSSECVGWEKDGFVIAGQIETIKGESELLVGYEAAKRKISIQEDGAPVSLVTLYGRYPVIIFLPEDTFLLVRGPEVRRNFMNSVLVSIPQYLSGLVQYYRVLKQRNAALKQASGFDEVAGWTEVLLKPAEVLYKQRQVLTAFLAAQTAEIYKEISGEECEIKIDLKTDVTPDKLREALEKSFSQEKRYGHTLLGPHRDDLVARVGGRPGRNAMSQGQMRSLVIAMKIASHRFLEQVVGEKPLVLLDEVLSELDEGRQEALLTHLPDTQIVMTCTALPEALKDRDDVSVLDVRGL